MAAAISWKMLIGPVLLMGLKIAKVDYQTPANLLIVRILYGLSQVFLFGVCAWMARAIKNRGDVKTLKIVTPLSPGEEAKETEVTYKEYDMGELLKLVKNFAAGAALAVGIHVYMQVVPAILLQLVTQPITLIEHPLFQIYVLNKDPAKDSKLKRPFPDNSPRARIEAASKEAQKQKELLELQNQSSTQAVTEGESVSTPTSLDTGVGGNAQTSVSTAERRSTRPSTTED